MILALIPAESLMWFSLVIFLVTYILLLLYPKYRAYIALGSALFFIGLGILPMKEILPSIDWNVLMMIAGTMGLVVLFIESKMPALLADKIIQKVPNVRWAIVSLALFAGIISAFVDNVATVIMVAPVALNICKKLKISPVSSIVAIAVSANLQGAATLVGDTTSILLGQELKMSFFDFFWYANRPGLFFVVEVGALATMFILLYLFRKENQAIDIEGTTKVTDYLPSILLLGMIGLLIIASFVPYEILLGNHDVKNGVIVMSLLIVGLVAKPFQHDQGMTTLEVLKEIDYFTLLLLAGLFLVIKSIENAGVIAAIGDLIEGISSNPFVLYTILVWFSVLVSAFIDNIPYVATMLTVIGGMDVGFSKIPLYFGMLVGATLGGNITPIGASANIAGIGILRKEGYEVKAKQFMKISVPFTLVAVLTGYILVWLFWGI